MSYTKDKQISQEDNYMIPNWDQRGISTGYGKFANFDEASAFVDSAEADLKMLGYSRMSMGNLVPGGTYEFGSGTVTAPGIRWAADTNTGWYLIGDANVGASVNGTLVYDWNASQLEFATGYKLRIGTATAIYGSSSETFSILETQNNASGIVIKNASTGTLGFASVACLNSTDNDVTFGISSTGLTGQLGGVMTIGAGDGFVGFGRYSMTGTGADFWVYNLFSTKSIIFATAATRRGSWVSGGALIVGTATSALASELLRVQGGIVSSTLTQSGVVYAGANGLLSTDHTHLTYDASNFRLGINNSAPNRPLDVVSATTTTVAARFSHSTSNVGMYLLSFANSQLCMAGGAEFVTSNWIARAAQATIVLSTGDGVTGGDLWIMNGTGLTPGNSFTPTTRIYMSNTGLVGIGTGAAAARRLESLDATNPQLRLSHTASTVVTDLQTNSSGNLTISPTNDIVIIDDALRVGTVATAADAGDFETGLTGAGRMFYDQSVPSLTFYNSSGTVVNLISSVASTATVWNEQGADIDFRIEGDTNANLFFLDASADKVGIGTSSPDDMLDVAGNITFSGGTGGAFNVRVGNNAATFDIEFLENTSTAARFRAFRTTNTSASCYFEVFKGDGSATTVHQLASQGDVSYVSNDTVRNFGIGATSPGRKCEILDVNGNPQLRLSYTSGSVYSDFQTTSGGGLTITTSASDLFLSPGGGNVKFGTHSAIAAETVTGYITIKDAGGTTRKLAVVS